MDFYTYKDDWLRLESGEFAGLRTLKLPHMSTRPVVKVRIEIIEELPYEPEATNVVPFKGAEVPAPEPGIKCIAFVGRSNTKRCTRPPEYKLVQKHTRKFSYLCKQCADKYFTTAVSEYYELIPVDEHGTELPKAAKQ